MLAEAARVPPSDKSTVEKVRRRLKNLPSQQHVASKNLTRGQRSWRLVYGSSNLEDLRSEERPPGQALGKGSIETDRNRSES